MSRKFSFALFCVLRGLFVVIAVVYSFPPIFNVDNHTLIEINNNIYSIMLVLVYL